ncbi:hypothetical protein [Mesobacillus harenae]|uniref:hypothetical protein n=1 Tax=Mesobacillus harenae TaxID=2213203 RepID=UPI0015807C52|nr:hypothetical protein [Mesobacillus harenae]
MKKEKEYLTQAPEENAISIETDGRGPNLRNYPGDSVNEHKNLETANILITGDEIRQQNENL